MSPWALARRSELLFRVRAGDAARGQPDPAPFPSLSVSLSPPGTVQPESPWRAGAVPPVDLGAETVGVMADQETMAELEARSVNLESESAAGWNQSRTHRCQDSKRGGKGA